MSGMVSLAGLALDEVGHAGSRPQSRAIPQDFRSFGQAAAQAGQLLRAQSWLAACPPRLLQSLLTAPLPLVVPTAGRFPGDTGLASDFSLATTFFEESGGLEAPLFQGLEITLYTFRVTHAPNYSMSQAMCHYIMR